MELKELYEKTLALFEVQEANELQAVILKACTDHQKLSSFCELVKGDLSVDWMQMIYQYYLADRKDKKQDYTPASIARFMCMLAGDSDVILDMCAGSGALTIQRWLQNPDQKFRLIELDKNVIPFLLFNLVIRNIDSSVCRMDVLSGESFEQWRITKGEKYGNLTCVKSAV